MPERIQPEVICQNRIPHAYVSCYALVVAAISEDTERSGEMLLPVQTFRLERVKFWVSSDLQLAAVFSPTHATKASIAVVFLFECFRVEDMLGMSFGRLSHHGLNIGSSVSNYG